MKFLLIYGFLTFTFTYAYSQEVDSERFMGAPIDVRLDKGNFFIGGTLGLDLKDAENQNQILTTALSENSDNFNLRLDGGYALQDDFFAGMAFLWGVTNRTGEYQDANTGDISDVQFFSTRYSIRPFIKNHLPLTPNRRFNLVVQTELRFSLDQSLEETDLNEIVTRTYRDEWGLGIGVRPGLLAFVMNNFAVEASVNVAGIGFSVVEINETDMPDVNVRTADLDLKIDILQLNLGFVTYF